MNAYETDRALAEYLLFHYGAPAEVLPFPWGPREALGFPERCVSECLNVGRLPPHARALDLGCAVGGATWELARHCGEVLGVDASQRFIDTAQALQAGDALFYPRVEEGELTTVMTARVPAGVDRDRVRFEQGDACALRPGLGAFDVVLAANLLDRVHAPQQLLRGLPALVRTGGQLILTSPYTWAEEWTPRDAWLGGRPDADGRPLRTLDALRAALDREFELVATRDLPFLLREHARKFQWSVAQATIWARR